MTNKEPARSIRQLAERLGYSHSSVRDWIKRPDWPFPTAPPFPADLVSDIRDWVDDADSRDRRIHRPTNREPVADMPFADLLTWQNLIDPTCPLNVRPRLGTLFAELTTADLESLAEHMRGGIALALIDVEAGRGETRGIPTHAKPAYFARLLDDANQDRFAHYLDFVTMRWLARRFLDRPDWWREMPEPLNAPPSPDDPRFADLTPLPHRGGKGAA